MKQRLKMKSILCLLLALLLALPQCATLYAEEESEPDTAYTQESIEEKTLELSDPADEENEELPIEVQTKEDETEEMPAKTESEADIENETEAKPQDEPANILSLSETYIELLAGDSFHLEVTLDGALETGITWSSDSPDIVSVDETGTINALKEGIATISVSLIDGSASSSVLVKVLSTEASDIEFKQKSYEIMVGDKITIPYELSGDNYEDIVWSISDESIAKIETAKNGEINIQTMSSGVVQVNALVNGVGNSFSVVVIEEEDLMHASTEAMNASATSIVNASYSINYNQSSVSARRFRPISVN